MSDNEQRTVDGVPVKVGDRVWRAAAHLATVTMRKLDRWDLSFRWDSTRKEIYLTERAAIAGQIANQKKAHSKALQEARRATKAIDRLTTRLRNLEEAGA